MKKLILLLILPLFINGKIFSQLADENFDYAEGDSLQQHNWFTIGSVYTNRMLVTSPGLSFPDYINSDNGNAVRIDTTGQDVYRDFSSPRTSGNIYASFLVNVKTSKPAGDYFASLLSSTSTTSLAGRVYAKDSSGNIAFGLSKTTETVSYTPARYFKDTTYLLILKYSINPGAANDSVSLFVYSPSVHVPSSEQVPDIGPKGGTGADLTDLGRFSLRQGTASSAPRVILDGIYITTTWDNSALPVELVSFNSVVSERNVTLNWATASENNNAGFEIERKISGNESQVWVKAGNIKGKGNSNVQNSYAFTDMNLYSGTYQYRLKQTDFNGSYEYFYLNNDVNIGVPEKFSLQQNYPNPFNPVTNVEFGIPELGFVSLKVHDMLGKEVATLVNENLPPGYYTVKFNGINLSSGVYFCIMKVKDIIITTKMMLMK